MTTTNLGMTVPTVGADSDVWGDELNADLALLDSFVGNIGPAAIWGLTLSTAGSSGTFAVAAGAAGASAGPLMKLASSISKNTNSWAVGTGNGALDTGAIANNTWYHVWQIMKTDLSVTDILISLSPTAPTMPSGYTFKRRIGALLTNGSAQWVKFVQKGDLFLWDVPAASADINYAPTGTATAKVVNVPTGVNVLARLRGLCQIGPGDATTFLIFSPSQSITSIGTSDANVIAYLTSAATAAQGYAVDVLTNTSAQVNVIGGGTSGSSLIRATAIGWTDPRGQW